ncbi:MULTISPECIES: hypothetical protein [Bacteroidota]|uniref:hypothetical protein n=1 Tax=Flavobacterium sp. TaxID=239 RepID=UPI004048C2DC
MVCEKDYAGSGGTSTGSGGYNTEVCDYYLVTVYDHSTNGTKNVWYTYISEENCRIVWIAEQAAAGTTTCPSGTGDGEIPVIEPNNELIDALVALLLENPDLLLNIPCEELAKWLEIAQHAVPQQVQDKISYLDKKFGGYSLLTLPNANGYTVNMDYFSVTVSQLPTGLTAESLLSKIRTDLNRFVNTDISSFSPSREVNTGFDEMALWLSNNPVGAVLSIEIPADDGSVICSDFSRRHWRFSTIKSPWDYDHPVSGTREFGFTQNQNGTWTFYTRGVDRFTQLATSEAIAWMVGLGDKFKDPDSLWSSLQSGISSYVNNNGGQANVNNPEIWRPSWKSVKDVLMGNKPISDLGCK